MRIRGRTPINQKISSRLPNRPSNHAYERTGGCKYFIRSIKVSSNVKSVPDETVGPPLAQRLPTCS
jgi:hypothetical protein